MARDSFVTLCGDWSFPAGGPGPRNAANCELTRVYCQCIDRHIATRGDKVAIIYEGDEPGAGQHITYRALLREVCRVAASLREMVRTRACLVARASSHPRVCGVGGAGGGRGCERATSFASICP
jgi:hypothetical protein